MKLDHFSRLKTAAYALGISAAAASRRRDFEAAMIDLESIQIVKADPAREPVLISPLVGLACGATANNRAWSVRHARGWNDAQLARLQRFMTEIGLVKPMPRSLEFERAITLQVFRTSSNAELKRDLVDGLLPVVGGRTRAHDHAGLAPRGRGNDG